jgi:ubiquinone/menaquinone biosynthesis C-methylase UbiE/hypothetical membrane protein
MRTTTSMRFNTTTAPQPPAQPAARLLAMGAIAGPVLLTLAWVVLGLTRPATKNAWGVSGGVTGMISQPFSGLGLGTNGSLFNAAFVLSGLLLLAGVIGVFQTIEADGRPVAWRAWAALLALSALGLIVCGIYTLESFLLHMMGFVLGCVTPVASFLVTGLSLRRLPPWRRFGTWLLVGSPLTLLLLVIFFLTFDQTRMSAGLGVAGLTERILVVEVLGWFVAMGWLAMRRTSRAPAKAYKGPAMEGFIATWYAKNTRGDARSYRDCAHTVAERVPTGGSVLELAAGPGYLAIEIARFGRHRVFGLDISKSFVRIATDNARAEGVSIEFRQGNASQMPYADESFDFVVCRAAFKNFGDPGGALNEIHRVLKPGGKASIFDLRAECSREEIKALVDGMNLSPLNAMWTKLTFRFFLLKNAYDRGAITRLAAESRFGRCDVLQSGVEFDLRLAKA